MIKIPGDDGYSHAHYWRHESPRCGLHTPSGTCAHPCEPGTPWCNPHTVAWLTAARRSGYVHAEQIRWASEQAGHAPDFTDALIRRWTRFHAPPPPVEAPQEPAAAQTEATPALDDSAAPSVTETHGRRPRRL